MKLLKALRGALQRASRQQVALWTLVLLGGGLITALALPGGTAVADSSPANVFRLWIKSPVHLASPGVRVDLGLECNPSKIVALTAEAHQNNHGTWRGAVSDMDAIANNIVFCDPGKKEPDGSTTYSSYSIMVDHKDPAHPDWGTTFARSDSFDVSDADVFAHMKSAQGDQADAIGYIRVE